MLSIDHSTRTETHRKAFFTQVPDALAEDPRLLPRDVTTVMGILRFARSKSWASMGNATLASLGRCTPRTIQLSLARLEAAGWIRRVATDADIGSATKRVVYLTWREGASHCAPQAPPVAPPPAHPIAPEPESQEIQTRPAVMGSGSPRPEPQTKGSRANRTHHVFSSSKPPARPVARRSDVQARYPTHKASEPMPLDPGLFSDWLARPVGDALRQMAERRLLVGSTIRPVFGKRST